MCPSDKSSLRLDVPISSLISEGEYKCVSCDARYPIINGVPYFFEKGNGFEWEQMVSKEIIVESITETIEDKEITWAKISSLSNLLLNRLKNRKKTIDLIFGVVEQVIKKNNLKNEKEAYLLQAATAARYDVEIYRGTFKLKKKILDYLRKNYNKNVGIILEGACATGECLSEIEIEINSDFYIGLDISGSLIRIAQRTANGRKLFVQGDICYLPIKTQSTGIYVLNNVFDRVSDPPRACREADKILDITLGLLVLSNCDPLQYSYNTEEGEKIIFVPEEKQLSLEDALKKLRCDKTMEQNGIWEVETVAYGKENLPYKSLVGRRGK